MKRLPLLLTLLAIASFPPSLSAQTTVNLTVQDTGSVFWSGPWTAVLRPPPGFPPNTNMTIVSGGGSTSSQSGTLSTSGTASLSLPSNSNMVPVGSLWYFTVCFGSSGNCFSQLVNVGTSSPQAVTITPPAPGAPASGGAGGGAGAGAVNGVINVTDIAYGASSSLADNATAFAAVASAANTAAYVSVGTPTIRSTVKTVMSSGTISSATATVNITAGDTVLVGTIALNATVLSYTVSDGVNTYYPVNLNSSPVGTTNEQVQVFGTVPGAAKAFSGTLTVTITAGGPAQMGFIVLDAFNVGSYGQTNLFAATNVGTTTPSVTATTQDANNIFATWMDYCNAAGVTISQNTGTLQQSWNSTASICGGGLVTNTAASALTSLTTSASLTAGSNWAVNGIELRSVTTKMSTVYFPAGRYTYTSGLSFTNPVTLKGEPGAVLCYAGTAHAIDIGPAGLAFSNLQSDYYYVDGLRFECGAGMTQGIFLQNNVIYVEIKNNTFLNFGNGSSAAIFSNGDTEDLSVKLNHFLIFDGPPPPPYNAPSRKFIDLTTNAQFSTLTMTNNYAACVSGKLSAGVGCSTLSGPLVNLAGYAGIISNNNVGGGFCPAIQLGSGGVSAPSTRIQNNNFEVDTANCNAITYKSTLTDGLKVLNNFFSFKATNTALLGPADGTQLLTNAEVSNNVLVNQPTNFPVVVQNNLAGQTGNIGWHNTCSTAQGSGTTPCPLLHTTGASINQWNNDYAGTCTMSAGVCPTYNFLVTYGAAPKCTASWTGSGTFTGILQVISTTSTLIVKDLIGTDTGVMNWTCNPEAQ